MMIVLVGMVVVVVLVQAEGVVETMVAGISPLGFRSRKFQENVTIISV
jgi:hypothetical protein